MRNQPDCQIAKAFTLIELLVVIAIIALLSTLSVVSLNSARAKARDSRRLSDVRQIQTALDSYFDYDGIYPASLPTSSPFMAGGLILFNVLPKDPIGDDNYYHYTQIDDGGSYTLDFSLESGAANYAAGSYYATPGGIVAGNSGNGGGSTPSWACGDSLVDPRDSNSYQTILIGTQCWMKENLKYLPSVVGPATGHATNPYYYVYGYSGTDVNAAKATANYATYGVLYNWPAIMQGAASSNSVPSGVQGVCPTGWHVPSHNEWTDFSTYLGSYAGGKAKEAGTTHWSVQTCGSTACNLSGFTALPAGARSISGSFVQLTNYAFFWTATKVGPYSPAYRWQLQNTQSTLISNQPEPQDGYSLRCLKD